MESKSTAEYESDISPIILIYTEMEVIVSSIDKDMNYLIITWYQFQDAALIAPNHKLEKETR